MQITKVALEGRAYRRLLGFIIFTQPVGALLAGLYSSYFLIYATDVLLVAPAMIGTLIAAARMPAVYAGVSTG